MSALTWLLALGMALGPSPDPALPQALSRLLLPMLPLGWLPLGGGLQARALLRCCPGQSLLSGGHVRPGDRSGWVRSRLRLAALPRALLLVLLLVLPCTVAAAAAEAAPGVCVGQVCGDEFRRSGQHPWQLRLRLSDQRGHRERVTVDCRDGRISPGSGPVERGFGAAVARRACRLADQQLG